MQDRPVFPDFSAFQIDIPHSTDAHETLWPGGGHPDADLYAAFWPDIGTPASSGTEPAASPEAPVAEPPASPEPPVGGRD